MGNRSRWVSPDRRVGLGVGFTPNGDVVADDPFARLEQGRRVRRTYTRANVERA